jgi:enterochelin esterase-like enzyme
MQKLQKSLFIIGISCLILVSVTGCQGQSVVAAPPEPTSLKTTEPASVKPPELARTATNTSAPPTPTITPSPTPEGCPEKAGKIIQTEMATKLLPYPLKLRIYLPPCFEPGETEGYPVIILLHGQGSTDDQWDRLGIAPAADNIINAGETRPFLIVMPREEYYLQDPVDSKFDDALIEELLPMLKQQYGACAPRNCWAIGGISRGAAWAVRIGLINWSLFGSIGAHSLPPFKNDPYRLPEWLRLIPQGEGPRLWIDIGTLDTWLKSAIEFEDLLNLYHFPFEWHLFSGIHNEAYWQKNIEVYQRWYTQIWKLD